MSCHASIRRHVPSPPIAAEGPRGISRAQEWRPGSILTLASEAETELVIDRLLRECFTLNSPRA
jgi:hypothetical protein